MAGFGEKLTRRQEDAIAALLDAPTVVAALVAAGCERPVLVLVEHDEIVVECDVNQANAAATWLKAAMVDGMAPLVAPVPVEVEVQIAPTWGG